MDIRSKQSIDLTKQIAVVIITQNRVESLVRTLTRLSELPDKCKIIVVDNNSSDATITTVQASFPDVQIIPLNSNQGALGRNIGVKAAGTPFVAFCDDDSWWEAGVLSKAIEYFNAYPQVGLIAGKILVNDVKKLDPCCALLQSSPLPQTVPMPGPAILGFIACGVFVRTKAYEAVGGFNKLLDFGGEEMILGIDLANNGWGLTYVEDIIGYHYPSPIRNVPERHKQGFRNEIRLAWLRRPARSALKVTWKQLKKVIESPNLVKGVFEVIASIPAIIRNRQVVPDYIEEQLVLLEQPQYTHSAPKITYFTQPAFYTQITPASEK